MRIKIIRTFIAFVCFILFGSIFCVGLIPAVFACDLTFTSPGRGVTVTTPNVTIYGTGSGSANPGDYGTVTLYHNNQSIFTYSGVFTGVVDFFRSRGISVTLTEGDNRFLVTGSVGGCSASDSMTLYYAVPKDKELGIGDKKDNCLVNLQGNPINFFNGNKVEVQMDLSFRTPFAGGLTFARYYNSQSSTDGPMGFGWSHNFLFRLSQSIGENPHRIKIMDGTGRGYYFQDYNEDGVFDGEFSQTSAVTADSQGYHVWKHNDVLYQFDSATGRLLSITDANGNSQALGYDSDGLLLTITDTASARILSLHYNEDNRLTSVTGPVTDSVPDGIWVSYEYDHQGNLVGVTYADDDNGSGASGMDYRYEDALDSHNLTGKYDLSGCLLSAWTYNDLDMAIENINREGRGVTIDYVSETQVTVTDAYGVDTTYSIGQIAGAKKILSKSRSGACDTCSQGIKNTEFDLDEGVPTQRTWFNGRVDEYQGYDNRHNIGTIISSVGTVNERTITRTFHPDLDLPMTITEKSLLVNEGTKEIIFDFDDPDAEGDTDEPNEAPTSLVHRRIDKGFTTDSSGTIVPYTHVTRFSYNVKGLVQTVDGPLDGSTDTTIFEYDAATGNLTSVAIPLSLGERGTIYFDAYDAAGNITRMTDLNGVTADYTYDGRNRIKTTTIGGKSSEQTYTLSGDPAEITDRTGRTTARGYNLQGFVEKIINPGGDYLYFNYDANANRIEESIFTTQGSQAFTRSYDFGDPASNPELAPGEPWKLIKRDQADTTDLDTVYTYEHGRVKTVTLPDGLKTIFFYDEKNQVVEATRTKAGIEQDSTHYSYDTHGNLTGITDAQGHTTTYQYDDLDRLVKTISPDTGTTVYAYNEAGNMIVKDQNGGVISYDYDDAGRLTQVNYPDAPARNTTLSYDAGIYGKGRLTAIHDASGDYAFFYNNMGYLILEVKTISGTVYTTEYTYDAEGRITTITYPSGKLVNYHLDAAGRPERIDLTSGHAVHPLASQISWHPFGPLKSLTFDTGHTLTFDRDLNYLVRNQALTGLIDQAYVRDISDNVVLIDDHLAPLNNKTFGYDNLNRLISSDSAQRMSAFTYDPAGNRQTKTVDSATDIYTYLQGTNKIDQISSQGITTYSHHPNGTIQNIGSRLFEYDSEDRLVRVTDGPEILGEYEYNYLGQRISKTINSTSTIFHYDLNGNLIAETASDGTVLKEYVYLEGDPLAMIVSGPANYDPADLDQDGDIDGADLAGFTGSSLETIAQKFGKLYDPKSNIYYYHNDHLGTPLMLTNEAGDIYWHADYAPFGKAAVSVNLIENNLRFPGQYYDAETGLHYNWYRYYAPMTGRYITPDPIGLMGDINLFVYALNNPMNMIDPLGLQGNAGHMTPLSSMMSVNYRSPGIGRDLPRPSQQTLKNISEASWALAYGSTFCPTEGPFGEILFLSIGTLASSLEIALYPNKPIVEALSIEAMKQFTDLPSGSIGPYTPFVNKAKNTAIKELTK